MKPSPSVMGETNYSSSTFTPPAQVTTESEIGSTLSIKRPYFFAHQSHKPSDDTFETWTSVGRMLPKRVVDLTRVYTFRKSTRNTSALLSSRPFVKRPHSRQVVLLT